MDEGSQRHSPGASFAYVEPPDICVWRCVGYVSAADIRAMYDVQSQFAESKRYLLVLVDLTKIGAVPAETRKAAAERREVMPVRGTAFFGGSFHFRVVTKAVSTAIRLLFKPPDNPMR